MKCDLCKQYITPYNSIELSTIQIPTVNLCHGEFTERQGMNLKRIYRDCVSVYAGMNSGPEPIVIDTFDDQHVFKSWASLSKWASTRARDEQQLSETLASLDHSI